MCVIIIKQKNNVMSRDVAEASSRINPHGLGIVWLDTFEVSYHNSNEYQILLTTRPFIAHFRFATVGKVGLSNTHPFVCGENKDEMLMQNGTISGLGTEDMCDSKMLANSLGTISRRDWKDELEQYDSRFCTVNLRTKSFQIYNKSLYTYSDGIWFSKDNVLQYNLVAVYGTLKMGFSNNPRYLSNAKYLGSGVTKYKYPLVIDSLPYLVNKVNVGYNVKVDVFKVSNTTFNNLDALEGHPSWYKREQISIYINGEYLTCWVYFNPKDINEGTEIHKEYLESGQKRFNFYDESPQKPMCIDCYNDVEHDGFYNYYCSSCGSWFEEDDVLYQQ